jgi:hypothetical protein
MNRIARGCASRSGGFARARDAAQRERDEAGFALRRAARSEVVVLAPPVEDEHAAVLAFLADGESWSSSALGDCARSAAAHRAAALDALAAPARCSRSAAAGARAG